MDYSCRRFTILVVYWIIMATQLLSCKSHQQNRPNDYLDHHQQLYNPHKHFLGYNRGDASMRLVHIRESRDTQTQDRGSRQDEGGPMPMLNWMRQMIFKTKSMYTKHKLEFELSGCFLGFIRKIISLIYNSLYSFNKKLMYAKNIKMEDIRRLGKASGSLPMNVSNSTIPDLTPATTKNFAVELKVNDALFNNVQNSGQTSKTKTGDINSIIGNKAYIFESNLIDKVFKVSYNKDKRNIRKSEIVNSSKWTEKLNKKVKNESKENKDSTDNVTEKYVPLTIENPKLRNNNKETSNNTSDELERMYVKLVTMNEQSERNLNKMNTLYENILMEKFNNFKDTVNKISRQEVKNDDLTSKLRNNISQSIVTDENQLTTRVRINDKIGTFNQPVLGPLEVIGDKTLTLDNVYNNRQENISNFKTLNFYNNKTINPKIVISGKKSSDEILDRQVISQNEISKYLANSLNDKSTTIFENRNKYNFTPAQIKIISNRVRRLLNHLRPSSNQNETDKSTSRQFSQDTILDSINSVILYFLGFTPEEESLAYFMSMVGKETSENIMMIGSSFNAMRHSQLFSCMAHYGSTKFWNWVDSCC